MNHFALSDASIAMIATGAFGVLSAAIAAGFAYLTKKLEAVAFATKSIALTTEEVAKTANAVHVLVNSSMSAQLHVAMVALHRVAELTNNAEDIAGAELAAKLYREHEAKQKIVDGMPPAN